jgi:cbb3-type cytochrome oxidase maturation protein
MDIIFILIPFSLLLVGFFIGAFIWSTKSGQHEDLETPAHRMLLEDEDLE